MIQLDIEGFDKVEAVFKSMLVQVEQFGATDMPTELTTWQTDDMHRRTPNTEEPEKNVAQTIIWQRGRQRTRSKRPGVDAFYSSGIKSRHKRRRRRRQSAAKFRIARRGRRHQGKSGPSAARPILREVLYADLQERMRKLLTDKLTWRT